MRGRVYNMSGMKKKICILLIILLPGAVVFTNCTDNDSHKAVEEKLYAQALEYVNEADKLTKESHKHDDFNKKRELTQKAIECCKKAVKPLEELENYYYLHGIKVDSEAEWAILLYDLRHLIDIPRQRDVAAVIEVYLVNGVYEVPVEVVLQAQVEELEELVVEFVPDDEYRPDLGFEAFYIVVGTASPNAVQSLEHQDLQAFLG